MIEDQELRDLFQAESEEHLQKLDEGLLYLERHPDDAATLKELFREAHSLKGSARMLGVGDVETVAHRFEDLLGAAAKGNLTVEPLLVDRLVRALDEIRLLVRESVTGEAAGVSVFDVLKRLVGEESPPAAGEPSPTEPPPTEPPPTEPPLPTEPPVAALAAIYESIGRAPLNTPPADPALLAGGRSWGDEPLAPLSGEAEGEEREPEVVRPPSAREEKEGAQPAPGMDTIRVDSRKLDLLLNQAGELSVLRNRVSRRMSQVEDAMAQWEALARTLRNEEGRRGPGEHNGGWRHLERLGGNLEALRQGFYEDEIGLGVVSGELGEGIRNLRLLPLSTLFNVFARPVRDLARELNKQARLVTVGGEVAADKRIIEEMKDPLMHMIRNALHHGLEEPALRAATGKPEEGVLRLSASRTASHLVLELQDDGAGLNVEAIHRQALKKKLFSAQELEQLPVAQLYSLVFASGFSTSPLVTDVSGRGVGLDAVRANVERLKGTIQVDSQTGQGCRFTIRLPVTLATTPVFVVRVLDERYAIPLDFVQSVKRVERQALFPLEGRDAIDLAGEAVHVAALSDLLELPPSPHHPRMRRREPLACIVLRDGEERLGVFVDELEDQIEVVQKPHGAIIKRLRYVSGATILGSGEVCQVLHPVDLILAGRKLRAHAPMSLAPEPVQPGGKEKSWVLLVEDSITTRTQLKRILEGGGYQVTVAVDGMDALEKLGRQSYDAVVSDVEMPNLNGLELTARIRSNDAYQELPVILVTTLSTEEDLKRGLEAGANAYLTKPSFDQGAFLETVGRLV